MKSKFIDAIYQYAARAGSAIVRPWTQSTLESQYRRFEQIIQREHGGASSVGVTEAYLRSVWVYGAISIIAQTVARTPFKIMSSNGKHEFTNGPIVDFIAKPNRYPQQNTSSKFREAYLTLMLSHGAVMRLFTEMQGDRPLGMIAMPRYRYTPIDGYDEHGIKMVQRWLPRGGIARNQSYLPGDEIHHDALFNPMHDYEGLSPLASALSSISNDIDVTQFAQRFFQNNANPGLVFTSDDPRFDQKEAENATKLWNDKRAGRGKEFDTVFLGGGLKPHTLGIQLDANVLVGLKSLTKEEIVTGIYKVPLSIFGASATSGNQGVVIGGGKEASFSEKETFVINVAMPWSRRMDEEFNNDVAWRFGSQYVGMHDWSQNEILAARRLERAQTAAALLKEGLPINAVIDWLKLEVQHVPWGDDWLVKNDMVTAAEVVKAGAKQLKSATEKAKSQSFHQDSDIEAKRHAVVDEYVRGIVEQTIASMQSGELSGKLEDALDLDAIRRRNGASKNGATN